MIDLFLNFFLIGLFTFGGGYSATALVEEYAVNARGFLTSSELNGVFAFSEMTPGPFSLNCATFVGGMTSGFWGALIATIGFVLPSFIIVILLAYLYSRFKENKLVKNILLILAICATANLLSSAITMFSTAIKLTNLKAIKNIDIKSLAIFLLSCVGLLGIKGHKVSPIFVIIVAAILGIFIY